MQKQKGELCLKKLWCYKFVLLFAFGFPNLSISGEDFMCGDWQCSFIGYARTWTGKQNQNGEFTYNIVLVGSESMEKQHYLSPSIDGLEVGRKVVFRFDNSLSLTVPVTHVGEDLVLFESLRSINSLEAHLKNRNSFSIILDGEEAVGPFSLRGSKKALSLLEGSEIPYLETIK